MPFCTVEEVHDLGLQADIVKRGEFDVGAGERFRHVLDVVQSVIGKDDGLERQVRGACPRSPLSATATEIVSS